MTNPKQPTPDLEEAMTYDTEDDAKTSTAHRHWSANWQIKCLSKEATND